MAAPVLNVDILKEVLLRCLDEDDIDYKTLTNFMLSGKEAFTVAMRYFSTARSLCISNASVEIQMKEGDNVRVHRISPSFLFYKSILKVAETSCEGINISDSFCHKTLKMLSTADFKHITVSNEPNLARNLFLKRCRSVQTVHIILSDYDGDIDEILSCIRSSCKKLKITSEVGSAFKSYSKIPKMSFIKELEISADGFPSAKPLKEFLNKKFPNLESVNFTFHLLYESVSTLSNDGNEDYANYFSKFRGKILILCLVYRKRLQEIFQQMNGQPNVVTDENQITKSLFVTDDLVFEYVYKMTEQVCARKSTGPYFGKRYTPNKWPKKC